MWSAITRVHVLVPIVPAGQEWLYVYNVFAVSLIFFAATFVTWQMNDLVANLARASRFDISE